MNTGTAFDPNVEGGINVLSSPILMVTNYIIVVTLVILNYSYTGFDTSIVLSNFAVPLLLVVSYYLIKYVVHDENFSPSPRYIAS
ncbi:MAG: hypothetical protein SXQ77_05580, partial [Halobacteria archaeon]|nr:hypothetical protein [Halobacteria archaeon]